MYPYKEKMGEIKLPISPSRVLVPAFAHMSCVSVSGESKFARANCSELLNMRQVLGELVGGRFVCVRKRLAIQGTRKRASDVSDLWQLTNGLLRPPLFRLKIAYFSFLF